MKKLLMAACLVFCTGCLLDPIAVGDTEEEVLSKWGAPAKQMTLSSGGQVWVYPHFGWDMPAQYLHFRNGRIRKVTQR